MTRFQAARGPLALALALGLLAHPGVAGTLWGALGQGRVVPVPAARLAALAGQHALVAGLGVLGAAVLGIGLGLVVTRPAGRPLRRLVETVGAGLQAIPPVVVVALAFPALGFGLAPTALALVAYAVLPILRATMDALDTVPQDLREAARAMGLTPLQRLREVDLPLAAPVVAGAVRTAAVLAVATAAVGALAGAATLGTPIVIGLQTQNTLSVLQGAAATASLAFLAEGGLVLALGAPARAARATA
ncbi:ABC transporter permease [Salinarimonas soli]|uniref:ABC transporter permease subunit n=1 Tax=Salinarimonas soli TaxID=1638099 RepID=A0A5B2VCW5_9HYPH|nr:ABC transporter permease subunit [Salinarimonas soli]KAA2236901.1 ABC transporter permease subunit [Salinarimonas soli]